MTCTPPDGTPDGAWCILTRAKQQDWYMAARWTTEEYGGAWFWAHPGEHGQVLSLPMHMSGRG